MRNKKKEEADEVKKEVTSMQKEIEELGAREVELEGLIKEKMMVIPNIIDESVPIGKDDTENVEKERFGEPIVPKYEIPYLNHKLHQLKEVFHLETSF